MLVELIALPESAGESDIMRAMARRVNAAKLHLLLQLQAQRASAAQKAWLGLLRCFWSVSSLIDKTKIQRDLRFMVASSRAHFARCAKRLQMTDERAGDFGFVSCHAPARTRLIVGDLEEPASGSGHSFYGSKPACSVPVFPPIRHTHKRACI